MGLKRKQIYLDVASDKRIQALAKVTGLSEAEHIRRAVRSYVADVPGPNDSQHPLLGLIGLCNDKRGPRDAAVDHDRYLYGRKR